MNKDYFFLLDQPYQIVTKGPNYTWKGNNEHNKKQNLQMAFNKDENNNNKYISCE